MSAPLLIDLIRVSLGVFSAGFVWICVSETVEAIGAEPRLGSVIGVWRAVRDGWAHAGEMAFHATQSLHADAADFPA